MPFNIGNPEERTVRFLAEVLKMTGAQFHREGTLPVDDPQVRCPDITRPRRSGLAAGVSGREGLKLTIEYFRKDRNSVILVTGGAGYIGSHAVKALKERI